MYRPTLSFDILNYSPPPPPQKKNSPPPSKFLTLPNKHNPIHPDYNNLRSTTPPPQYFNSPLTIYSQAHPLPPTKNLSTHQNDFPFPTNSAPPHK